MSLGEEGMGDLYDGGKQLTSSLPGSRETEGRGDGLETDPAPVVVLSDLSPQIHALGDVFHLGVLFLKAMEPSGGGTWSAEVGY